MENKMYNLATSYLRRGWSVLPCGKNKIPLIQWKEYQTRFPTEQEVKRWFETYPEAQVGIITGKLSNLSVVDVEQYGDPSFLPQETMIVSTGGNGYHYLFLYEEGITNKARIKELVDIRSEGGYIVAAGSCSDKGPYKIVQEAPLLPFPKELFPPKVDIFNITPGVSDSRPFEKRPLKEYSGFGKGSRNDEMARYIGYVLTQIHPADWDSEGWQIIQRANTFNSPPLAPNELMATFNSIKRTERSRNPLGRVQSQNLPYTMYSPRSVQESVPDPIMLGDETDEVTHLAEVADAQKIDQEDIYPLEMPCFDGIINGGVSPGDVVVIAGQSGHGKTSLAQDWTVSLIRGAKKVKALWFSYEVLPTHLWNKFVGMGINREDCIFTPAKNSTGNVAWVENKIKEGKEKFGIKAVFIDHLGFLLPKTDGTLGKSNMSSNYAAFITQIMRDLKTIALNEEVIIFLPVHMKKMDSKHKTSDIDDIKDSSGIGQESDLVFLIERERNKDKGAKSYFTDITKITLAKNRKTGATVIANFLMLNGRFAYDDRDNEDGEEFDSVKEAKKVTAATHELLRDSELVIESVGEDVRVTYPDD